MNLKPNLWTLLFGITFAALIYVYPKSKEVATPLNDDVSLSSKPDSDIIRIVNIGRKEFIKRRASYKTNFYDKMNSTDCPGIANGRLLYFQSDYFVLPETEIAQLYAFIKEGEENAYSNDTVYVYPTLKDRKEEVGKSDALQVLDLIFSVKDTLGEWHFFDFTEPCPPVCDPRAPFSYEKEKQ